jgi:hypothetical protein
MGELRWHAYNYGVGLTAMLAKHLIRVPGRLHLLRSVPAGIRYGLDPTSRKNVGRLDNFPRGLVALELLGMACGPLSYLMSVVAMGFWMAQDANRRHRAAGRPPRRPSGPGERDYLR